MKEFVEKLIGRLEERIEGLREFATNDTRNQIIGYKCAIREVNQLAEEYNNGWIPCEKELPETNESVLCWAKSTAR